ncbi:MAG: NFACT family protein [Candidatus Aenigmarchaeota archaeon]|nr:NFACT family protein [Candidatus Aenigmarchaeota archaeon]
MEKTEITSLDLKFLVKELRENLTGGMFRKIYQYGGKTKQFLFEIFVPAKGAFWLYADGKKIFLTKRKKAIPQEPPSFCMFLRKHLMGKKILDVKQHDFDRIVEVSTAESILIFELLSPGNVILCDTSYEVIMPLQVQRWRDREIRPKSPYKYPPKPSNPFELDLDSLKRSLARVEKKTIAYLAKNLGFGSVYASEICSRARIDEGKLTNDLNFNDILKLHEVIAGIGDEKPESRIYDETVSPFPLEIFKERESKPFGSFSEALDEFFSGQEIEIAKEKVKEVVEEKKEKVERIVERQEEALEKWERIEKDSRDSAERIYNNYSTVEGVLNGIRKAKDSGLSWDEIKQRIKSEGTPEAEAIKEIRENDGVVILDLGGKDVLIDIRKSPEENAQKYYEDAKWAKKKFGGTEEAKEEHEGKLERAEKEVIEQEQRDFRKEVFPVEKKEYEEEPKPIEENETEWKETVLETPLETSLEAKPRPRRKWFEKFKWFCSSQGFLVVAGRNASQNETLLKKHTEGKDQVFHADIPGAAFVIIKSEGHDIPEETKKEAAEFAAANSKAWARGMGNVDIFSVNPDRVSKTPPSGQYLPKGSFMIHGEREWYRNMELKLSVGVKIDREERVANVLSGPVMAIRKNSDYFVTIRPGFKKSMELATNIKSKILIKARPEDKSLIEQIPLDEFQVVIPSGMGDVVEYVGRDYI